MPEVLDQPGVQSGGGAGTGAGTGVTDSGAGAGSGAGEPGTGAGGSGGGQPQGGGQPASQGGDGIRQLREAYDKIKADLEPWQKLNLKPEQVSQYSGVYQKLYGEAAGLGRELGYPDEEISEALAEDPVRTLDFLRNEAARLQQGGQQRDGSQDLQELVQQHVEQAIGPIQQRENIRATNEANALFERTAYQEIVNTFKNEGIDAAAIPEDEKFMIISAASEILKYDEGALRALKYEGKVAPIQAAVKEAISYLDKYYLARSGRDRARVQPVRPGQVGQPGQQGAKKPTLDEIIDNPAVLGDKYR